jgi:hypothetical protein
VQHRFVEDETTINSGADPTNLPARQRLQGARAFTARVQSPILK